MSGLGRVIIVGAGPVGLSLAIALEDAGFSPLVLEKRVTLRPHSRAIGITPASLEIFDRYGVAADLVSAGVPVRSAVVHGNRGALGEGSFANIRSPFKHILSLPQRRTEEILLDHFLRRGKGEIQWGWEVEDLAVDDMGVMVGAIFRGADRVRGEAVDETKEERRRFEGALLIGCDGKHSSVRKLGGFRWAGTKLSETFLMADITDDTDLGDIAHLYFTSAGSVESFPLPKGLRRWIVQTEGLQAEEPEGLLQSLVQERTGVSLGGSEEWWRSSFQTERREASPWGRPPLFLAGDAAHLMPPIGGQGMNVGIADVEFLADLVSLAADNPRGLEVLSAEYERRRRRAFRVAARRSILGMKVGTTRGVALGTMRDRLVFLVLRSPLAGRLMEHFSMIGAPERRSPWRPPEQSLSGGNNRHQA